MANQKSVSAFKFFHDFKTKYKPHPLFYYYEEDYEESKLPNIPQYNRVISLHLFKPNKLSLLGQLLIKDSANDEGTSSMIKLL